MQKKVTSKREIKQRLGSLPCQKYSSKLWACLRSYALVLLENHTITDDLLNFSFSLFDPSALTELISELLKVTQPEDLLDEDDFDDLDLLAHRIYKRCSRGKISGAKLRKTLKAKLLQLRFKYQGLAPEHDYEKPLKTLASFFSLSKEEESIIKFYYCLKQSVPLSNIIEDLSLVNNLQTGALCTGLPFSTVKKNLELKAKLLACRIIFDMSRNAPYFELNPLVTDYISGVGIDIPLAEQFKRVETAEFPLESFSVPQQATDIITGLLKSDNPCHILLFGEQGTGKSEYAKSVVTACGMKAFFVQYGASDDVDERYFTICGATQSMGKDGIIIVDEADQLLNTDLMFFISNNDSSIEKGYLNTFLSDCKAKVIWITNKTDCVPASVKRRFTYSIFFEPFTTVERERVWNQHLKNNVLKAVITPEMTREFSRKFTINAAGIGSALAALRSILGKGNKLPDKEQVNNILCELIRRHQELVSGKAIQEKLVGLTNQYDLEALNLDTKPQQIVDSLKAFLKRKQHHQNTDTKQQGCGLNLLFWGPPGCGKSALGQYLHHELKRELIVKRASDLIDCYVGNTEKNIRRAFSAARKQGGILMLDEADSFLNARSGAAHRNSWEVTATNEILQQMENFLGILICTTNRIDALDKASLRRFTFKVEFKNLTGEGKRLLYKRYFLEQQEHLHAVLTPAQLQRLVNIPNLSAGDFKAVWTKLQYASEDSLEHDSIIEALANEVKYKSDRKGKGIGF